MGGSWPGRVMWEATIETPQCVQMARICASLDSKVKVVVVRKEVGCDYCHFSTASMGRQRRRWMHDDGAGLSVV